MPGHAMAPNDMVFLHSSTAAALQVAEYQQYQDASAEEEGEFEEEQA